MVKLSGPVASSPEFTKDSIYSS